MSRSKQSRITIINQVFKIINRHPGSKLCFCLWSTLCSNLELELTNAKQIADGLLAHGPEARGALTSTLRRHDRGRTVSRACIRVVGAFGSAHGVFGSRFARVEPWQDFFRFLLSFKNFKNVKSTTRANVTELLFGRLASGAAVAIIAFVAAPIAARFALKRARAL